MVIAGKKKSLGDIVFDIINCTVFILFTIFCIYPFYYMFINTISDNTLASKGAILFYPQGVHFGNYIEVLKLRGIGLAALISLSRTILGTFLTVLCSSFVAYIITQPKLYARKLLYRFIIVTMYFNAGLIPVYLNIRMLGLLNTFWVYIIPTMVVPYYLILIKTYIESLPAALQESAKIDGASYFIIFFKIVIPISIPILATITIFSAVTQWNTYLDTLYYVTKTNLYSLQYLLYNYLNELNSLASLMASDPSMANAELAKQLTPVSIRMTISMIIILPILFVYPVGQKYFLGGIMLGAVKG